MSMEPTYKVAEMAVESIMIQTFRLQVESIMILACHLQVESIMIPTCHPQVESIMIPTCHLQVVQCILQIKEHVRVRTLLMTGCETNPHLKFK